MEEATKKENSPQSTAKLGELQAEDQLTIDKIFNTDPVRRPHQYQTPHRRKARQSTYVSLPKKKLMDCTSTTKN